MSPRRAWVALVAALLPATASAQLAASSNAPLVAGELATRRLEVTGLPGSGEVRADANVGSLERIEEEGGRLVLHYRPPSRPFPQQLCLLLWRASEGLDARVSVVRLPILARTTIPVQTRRSSKVTIRVGEQSFGPLDSGPRGRIRADLLVPPRVSEAVVEVVDEAGLRSRKRIAIQSPPFNELSLALFAEERAELPPRFRVVAARADAAPRAPLLQLGEELLPLRAKAGLFSARWEPARRPPAGTLDVKLWLEGASESLRHAQLRIAPGKGARTLVLKVSPAGAPAPPRSPPREGLRADLGLSVGLMHNLGELLAPRVGAELGLDLPLPFGRLGLRLIASFARASQRIPSGRTGLAEAESTLMLIPFGGGVVYRMTTLPLSPFAFVAVLAQLVRSSTAAAYLPERLRYDWSPAVLGLAGIEPRLGPGRIFLQTGYQWSRVENPDLVVLGGGIVVEGGYRLAL